MAETAVAVDVDAVVLLAVVHVDYLGWRLRLYRRITAVALLVVESDVSNSFISWFLDARKAISDH